MKQQGFLIKRAFTPAEANFNMKFSFQLDSSPKKFVVSQALANVIGITEETRAKIVSALWQYIKSNRL
jgi:chromatin remodeling complex protein RSC6